MNELKYKFTNDTLFKMLEVTRHTPLTDRLAMIYFELPKLPQTVTANNGLELWLSLFRAKTEEELSNIEASGVQEMREAISAYRQITVTPEFQEVERLRSKARHDEAQALWSAERKKALELAKNLFNMGMTIEKVIEATDLTREEIVGLQVTSCLAQGAAKAAPSLHLRQRRVYTICMMHAQMANSAVIKVSHVLYKLLLMVISLKRVLKRLLRSAYADLLYDVIDERVYNNSLTHGCLFHYIGYCLSYQRITVLVSYAPALPAMLHLPPSS
jgi:hypothetical protein